MRVVATAGVVALLAGCASGGTPEPVPTASAPPSSSPSPSPTPEPLALPVGDPPVVAEGFTTPWSVVRLASGSSLVSERDTALIKEVTATGDVRVVGTVDGVQPGGEGGLLGLAVSPEGTWLYAYFTAAGDNRIVRFALDGGPGAYSLGAREDVLTGIAKAGNHNGGRIGFGPDGMLYATTGDAGNRTASQDPASLNGKILRMSPTGQVPPDNPAAGSLVYSLGHRNPQGIAWDASGQLWAAEFGQNTWDELNVIRPGGNYGWPTVEGVASDPAFVNPVYQWSTDEASPSGLAFTRGAFYLAALKGERLWSVTTDTGAVATPWFAGVFGRIRDAVPGPDGSLWMLTSNTDGRGDPRAGDDKLLQVALETADAG
ncbi:PQQ-dependent sugar dehydrogenase [Conyzicola nivalis]|uniref:Oxidoreductase n=2 Tax=Conyzicola nivalis TaxID=1477021 RepID=A0A916SPL0_9MICO|nr:oxidoreductase [Conyzicola nivalis]